jgi:hypothetical protein
MPMNATVAVLFGAVRRIGGGAAPASIAGKPSDIGISTLCVCDSPTSREFGLGMDLKVILTPPCIFRVENH